LIKIYFSSSNSQDLYANNFSVLVVVNDDTLFDFLAFVYFPPPKTNVKHVSPRVIFKLHTRN